MVTDRAPTGNFMLDRTLAKIGAREETADTRTWIKVLAAEDADYIREQALVRLVQHGILARQDGSFAWVFGRRSDTLDRRKRRLVWAFGARRHHEAERDIKRRVGNVLLSDDIPDPRDAALIGLVKPAWRCLSGPEHRSSPTRRAAAQDGLDRPRACGRDLGH